MQLILINTNKIIFKNNIYKARYISRNYIDKTTHTGGNCKFRKKRFQDPRKYRKSFQKFKNDDQRALNPNIEITNKINIINRLPYIEKR